MDDSYENIKEYNPNKKRKILIVFDDMIDDTSTNKKLNPIVTELFLRGRKLNISFVCITQPYFVVPKNIKLNSTHYENSIQKRTSTNGVSSFRYWLSRLYESL